MSRSLYELFRQCTVKISTSTQSQGTGFFVAPGLVLTCAHVVKQDDSARQATITVLWNHQTYIANTEQIRDGSYPDLALLSVACPDHPYVSLDEEIEESDELYSYGYPDDYPDGDSATFIYEGPTEGQGRLLKLKFGQVRPGLSGAPLINKRTRRVCGIIKRTRNRETDLGGRAIPITTVLQEFEQVKTVQREIDGGHSPWDEALEITNPTHLANETISYFSLLTTFLELEGQWFQDDFEHKRIYVPEKEYFDRLKEILATKHHALLSGHAAAGKTVLALSFARHLQEHAGYIVCYKDVKQAEIGDGRKWYALMREHDHPNLLYILDNCHLLPGEVDEFCRQWINQAPAYTRSLLVSRTSLADQHGRETHIEEGFYLQMFADDEKIQVRPDKIFWQVIEQYAASLSHQDSDYLNILKSDNKEKLARQHAHNLVISRSYLDAWQALGADHHLSEIRQQDTYQILEEKYLAIYGRALITLCILQRYEIRVHNTFIKQFPPDKIKQLEKEKLLIRSKRSTGYGQLYDLALHPSEAKELVLAYLYNQYGYVTSEHIDDLIISTLESYLKMIPSNYITVYENLARHKREDILERLLKNPALQQCAVSQFKHKEAVLDAIRYVYHLAKFDSQQAAALIHRIMSAPGIEFICAKLSRSTFQDIALHLQYMRFIDSNLALYIIKGINIGQLARQAKEENIQSLFRLVRTLQEATPSNEPSQAQVLLQAIAVETLAAWMTIRNLQDTIKQLQEYQYPPDRLQQLIAALDMQQFARQSESTSLQSLFWALHTLKKVAPRQARKLIKSIPLQVLSEKASASNARSIEHIVRDMREFGYSSQQIAEFVEAMDMEQVAQHARQGHLRRLTTLLHTLKQISVASATRLIENFTPADIAELLQHSSLKAIGSFLQDQYANRNVREGYALFQEQDLKHRLGVEPLDEINKFLDHLSRIRQAGSQLALHALNLLVATNITARLAQADLNQYALLLWHARSLNEAHKPQLLAPLHQSGLLQEKLTQSSLQGIQLLILNVAQMDIHYLQPIHQALSTINIIEKLAEASLRDMGYFVWNIYHAMDKHMAQEYCLLIDRHLQIQRLEKAPPEEVCFLLWNIVSISDEASLRLFDERAIYRLLSHWQKEAGWSAVLRGIVAITSEYPFAIHSDTEALSNWFVASNEEHSIYFLALALQGLRTYDENLARAVAQNVFLRFNIHNRLQVAKSSAITPRSIMLLEETLSWLEQLI